jgi:hypothetical protein
MSLATNAFNKSLELTATRRESTFQMIKTLSDTATLAAASGGSAPSRSAKNSE